MLKREGERLLIPVHRKVIRRLSRLRWKASFRRGAALVRSVWRTPSPCVVTASWVLDFDNFSAKVAENLGAVWLVCVLVTALELFRKVGYAHQPVLSSCPAPSIPSMAACRQRPLLLICASEHRSMVSLSLSTAHCGEQLPAYLIETALLKKKV